MLYILQCPLTRNACFIYTDLDDFSGLFTLYTVMITLFGGGGRCSCHRPTGDATRQRKGKEIREGGGKGGKRKGGGTDERRDE